MAAGKPSNPAPNNALLEFCASVHSTRDVEALERRLVEIVSRTLQADRGALLLLAEEGARFASICGWDSREEIDRPPEYSREIIDRVLREKAPVLSDAASGGAPAMCVPLVVFGRMRGALYVDRAAPQPHFQLDQLQWLTAIGAMAALVLENLRRIQWLENENSRLRAEIAVEHEMVGSGAALRELERFIGKVAPIDSTVLIQGESGTGKELIARAIHLNSPRADKPFVAINCAAIAESLLESEIFGYEKGAFTGAVRQQKGKLEAADGGSFFLDEIGELAPLLQAKLLRVLQQREFERVGGTQTIRVNIRLIAATNRDLKTAIQKGIFRQDLYYRLNVVSVLTPPLRNRKEDIPALAAHFARMHARKARCEAPRISDAAMRRLIDYDWPGNIRELENAIERAVVLGAGEWILPEDLPEELIDNERLPTSRYHDTVKDSKKELIVKAVREARGNYTEAAKVLGIHPNYLHRLIRNLNLKGLVG